MALQPTLLLLAYNQGMRSRAIAPRRRVWRYVDIERLVDLLDQRSIYLTRADLLGDPLEGTLPDSSVRDRQALVNKIEKLMPFVPAKWMTSEYQKAQKEQREWTFVTCWHLLEQESTAMWELYGRGVALRSTFGRLSTEFADTPIKLERVRYIDFTKETIDFLEAGLAFKYKRREFAHERELRGIWCDEDGLQDLVFYGPFDFPLDTGKRFSVDPNNLVEAVVTAPQTPPWKRKVIEAICRRFGYSGPVIPSSLDREPQL